MVVEVVRRGRAEAEGALAEGGVVVGEVDGEERSGVSGAVEAAGETGRATTAARAGTLRATARMRRAGMRGREAAEAVVATGTATTVERLDIWLGTALSRPPLRWW
jgi:hypothetical protein